jgi:hypothetical protein
LEAVAEVRALRAPRREGVEDVGVERPRAEALRQREADERVRGAGAGLELGVEPLAEAVVIRGAARGRFQAEQEGGLGARVPVVEKAPLAERREVADAFRRPAVGDAVEGRATRQMGMRALADVGPVDVGQA